MNGLAHTLLPLINIVGANGGSQDYVVIIRLRASDKESFIRVLVKVAGTESSALINPARADELINLRHT